MSLTKDQLTEGLEQDQTLHTLITNEYNSIKTEYSGNAHTDIEQERNSDASKFDIITWQKSKRIFGDICNEYDKIFYNWKNSSFHGEFPDEGGVIHH